jgi:PKD repeat protein
VNFSETSTLTVVGTREGGAPLPDGTVIRFTVNDNLGQITPNPVETRNGIAVATFIAGQRSGTAQIEAFSGETISEEVSIDIGEARVGRLIVTATPASLPPEGGKVDLRAFVRDEQGNPLSGVEVFFQATTGSLASNGDPVRTNSQGVARDTLRTTTDSTVTVTSGDQEEQLNITLGTQTGPACGAVASTTSAAVNQDISFVDTSDDPDSTLRTSTWDFGDGSQTTGFTATHSYDSAGTFIVVHTVTDSQGITDNCDPIIIDVQEGQAPTCSFDVAPSGDVNVGQSVSFVDTSTDPDGNITQSSWNFGDGRTANGTSVTHTYTSEGSFIVQHTVTDSEGINASCTTTVNVIAPGTAPSCAFTVDVPSGSSTATFNGSTSTDTDEGGDSIVSWSWNFGDNSAAGSGAVVNHTYAAAGTYNAVLTITDDEGDTANCTQQVIIPGT